MSNWLSIQKKALCHHSLLRKKSQKWGLRDLNPRLTGVHGHALLLIGSGACRATGLHQVPYEKLSC